MSDPILPHPTAQFPVLPANTGVGTISHVYMTCPKCFYLNSAIEQTWNEAKKHGHRGHCMICGESLIESIPKLTDKQQLAVESIRESGGVISRAKVADMVELDPSSLSRWNDVLAKYGVVTTSRGYVYDADLDESSKKNVK